jgi:hypothetical protein
MYWKPDEVPSSPSQHSYALTEDRNRVGGIMQAIRRYLAVSATALLLGCATIAPAQSSDTDRKLTEALEQALPTLVSSGDYRSASKLYLQLASARNRMNDTSGSCAALAQSLSYYRQALARETGAPNYEASSDAGNDEAMQDIRARFGCTRAQFG